MKITPVASPAAIQQAPQVDMKARAVAAFNAGKSSFDAPTQSASPAPQEHPVQNPSQVSVEELGAIRANTNTEASEQQTEETQQTVAEELQPKEKTPQETALSRQFAQLARQEKVLRAKQQQQDIANKAKEQALAAREAELAAKDSQYKSGYISLEQFKADPLAVMAQSGLSYDELTQQLLNQTPKDPRVEGHISRLEAKIKALEEASENGQKASIQQQEQQYNAAVRQIELDTKALVASDPAYETIKATRSVSDVVELITETYKRDGVLLSIDEAAQQVEDYLVEEALKITRIGKIKARLEQSVQAAKVDRQMPKSGQTQPAMKTLTNAASSSRKLSTKERAILAFRGELKS